MCETRCALPCIFISLQEPPQIDVDDQPHDDADTRDFEVEAMEQHQVTPEPVETEDEDEEEEGGEHGHTEALIRQESHQPDCIVVSSGQSQSIP